MNSDMGSVPDQKNADEPLQCNIAAGASHFNIRAYSAAVQKSKPPRFCHNCTKY